MSDESNASIPLAKDEQIGTTQPTLKRRIKIALRNAAASAMLPLALFENALKAHIPILSYHRVLPNFPQGSPRTANVDPRQYASQMHYLVQHGYETLSLDRLQHIIAGDQERPRRAVVITFDDGYADNFFTAHMIACEHGVTANYFLPTGIIDMPHWPYTWGPRTPQEEWHMQQYPELWRPLTWDEVRQMIKGGAFFGCHGYMHKRLSELGPLQLEEEISRSAATYQLNLGERPRHFSIPWGDSTAFTMEALPVLKANGIDLVYTTHPRRLRLPHKECLYPRISIREHDTIASFARKLLGAHDWLHRFAHPYSGPIA